MLSQGHDGLTSELHGDPITSDMQTGHFINDFEIDLQPGSWGPLLKTMGEVTFLNSEK